MLRIQGGATCWNILVAWQRRQHYKQRRAGAWETSCSARHWPGTRGHLTQPDSRFLISKGRLMVAVDVGIKEFNIHNRLSTPDTE